MTMLELIIATTMMTMVLVSVSVVLRTSRAAWDAHESDFVRMETAHSTVRHIVRAMRTAASVTAISDANSSSGSLAIQATDGKTWAWSHNSTGSSVNYGENTASSLLGNNIVGLQFVGYEADGLTPTTNVAEIQCVHVTVTVQLDRELASQRNRSVSSWAWVRTW
jgi:hypothetical protein